MQINSSYVRPDHVVNTSNAQVKDKEETSEVVSNEVASKPDISELDFSSMTNSELYDWMQSKHFDGELAPKDAWTIAYMMLDIPVGGLEEGQSMPIDDETPVDFFGKINDGIAWAKNEKDSDTVERLESLFSLMKGHQEKSINVFA